MNQHEPFEDVSPAEQLKDDIKQILGKANDALMVGDSAFLVKDNEKGIVKDVKERIDALETEKKELEKEIDHQHQLIQTSNRDFSDVKDTIPETQPERFLYFIEDYTLSILAMAYLIMVVAASSFHTYLSLDTWAAILESLVGFGVLTIFLFMLLYYLC
jgi:heptaprenylglyceryl phosphate synthase